MKTGTLNVTFVLFQLRIRAKVFSLRIVIVLDTGVKFQIPLFTLVFWVPPRKGEM